jgi:hypothetical protein
MSFIVYSVNDKLYNIFIICLIIQNKIYKQLKFNKSKIDIIIE